MPMKGAWVVEFERTAVDIATAYMTACFQKIRPSPLTSGSIRQHSILRDQNQAGNHRKFGQTGCYMLYCPYSDRAALSDYWEERLGRHQSRCWSSASSRHQPHEPKSRFLPTRAWGLRER